MEDADDKQQSTVNSDAKHVCEEGDSNMLNSFSNDYNKSVGTDSQEDNFMQGYLQNAYATTDGILQEPCSSNQGANFQTYTPVIDSFRGGVPSNENRVGDEQEYMEGVFQATNFQRRVCRVGELPAQDPDNSTMNALAPSDDTADTEGGSTLHPSHVLNTDADEDPWRTNLFDEMTLDEVSTQNPEDSVMQPKDRNHTLNLHSPGGDGEGCSEQHNDGNSFSPLGENDEQDDEDDTNDVNADTIDAFLNNERNAAEEGNSYKTESELKPEMGMEFKTRDEAQKFFNFYSLVAGFSMAISAVFRTTSVKRNREVTRVTLKCNKHGCNTEAEREKLIVQRQSNVISKTNYKVEMVITEKNGIWRVTSLNLEHNHDLNPRSMFFRSHAYMSSEEKSLIRTMKKCNIPTRKIVAVLAYIRGGMDKLPYNKRKVSNYGTKITRELENSDVMEVMEFFKKKQAESPGLCYSMEVDTKSKVRSVFWTDARSRLMYQEYGDCISFDTTFLTNKYNLPFAPIVGVSPHGKTYLFACALIVNETANTFKWLFQQFLAAMGGKHPESIITDHDKGMEGAISAVFPKATNRTCLFHVKKKLEPLCRLFQTHEGLYEEMQDIIDNSLTELEFESLWLKMIEDYKLGDHKIFQDMWKNRKKFVPVYFKSKKFPFIQTTARSEGTNALFKKGVSAQFSMTSFLREYQRIIDTIHKNEDELDHNSLNKKVSSKSFCTKYYIERQADDLYNVSIFRKFQTTLNDVTRLQIHEHELSKVYLVYQAKNYMKKEHRPRVYVVNVDTEKRDYSFDEIPEKYLIDRWRKKSKKSRRRSIAPLNLDSDSLRYNVLGMKLMDLGSSGLKNQKKYEYLLGEIDRIKDHFEDMDKEEEAKSTEDCATPGITVGNFEFVGDNETNASVVDLLNPDKAHTKGRPRMMTIHERIKKKKFYKCGHCHKPDHTVKTCTNLHLVFDLPKGKRRSKSITTRPAGKAAKKSKSGNDVNIPDDGVSHSGCVQRAATPPPPAPQELTSPLQ